MREKFYAILSLSLFLMVPVCKVFSQQPEVKIDLNMSGRPAAEVEEPGYTPWVITNGGPDSLTVNGVQFRFSKGVRGKTLSMTYYKAGVQTPNFARLTCDGMFVKDGDFAAGSEIILTIKGLPAGKHKLTTMHNAMDALTPATVCPIDVYVNDVLKINDLVPTIRLFKETECALAELDITAEAGKEVVVRFKAEESGSQPVKNVYINAVTLNVVNVGLLSRTPTPAHKDEHVDAPGNAFLLKWETSSTALSHDVYFGKDSAAVADADKTSPLFKGNRPRKDSSLAVSDLYSMDTYYWRVDEVDNNGTHKGSVWMFRTRLLAFAEAEGYGRFARGGRGGKVVEVTNLNDDGPGSLRWAVTNNVGPRTIVFTVSGVIPLKSRLVLADPCVTIAGQTAPGKGICIRSSPFGIGANDAILRNIRLRLGAGPTADGMGMNGNHSIMDHCSISWTIDEAFSSRGAKNITLQRTLISEALNIANHQNYPEGTGHGYAATIGGDISSFHHNLLAHNQGRNWSLGGGLDGNGFYSGKLDITNNVVYNWQKRTTDGGAMEVNFVNNYYKPGPSSTTKVALTADHEGVGKGSQRYYFAGNVMPGVFNEITQDKGRVIRISNGAVVNWETWVTQPFFPSYMTSQKAYDAYKMVLSDVGANQPVFDRHDIRMVVETRDSTSSTIGSKSKLKGLIDHEDDAGGFENYPEEKRADNWDTDHDGMPDWWENTKGYNAKSTPGDFTESNGDPDKDGYTYLEEYLNWMAMPHFSEKENKQIFVDLTALSRGYKASPVFTVANPINGAISIKNNSIAVFTPAKPGLGSFSFTVKDNEGGTMTRTINTFSGQLIDKAEVKTTFDAVRKDVATVSINWKTEGELDNDHFEVERSFNGNDDFVKINTDIISKAPGGNSQQALEYAIIDTNSYTRDTYYRLVQRDQAGKITVSDVKKVKGVNETSLQIWPVPNKGDFSLLMNDYGFFMLKIYDLAGQEVAAIDQFPGKTRIPIRLNQRGMFIVKIMTRTGKQLAAQKIIVQ